MGLTQMVVGFDMAQDGTPYMDQFESAIELLHVSPAQNSVERIAQFIAMNTDGILTNLPGGRTLLPVPTAKGDHLMLVKRGAREFPLPAPRNWHHAPQLWPGPARSHA
jgi:hypothetical protein